MQYYFVLTHYPDAEIVFYPSIDDCLKAVSEGKVGCTTLNGLRANDILRNSRYSGLALLQTTHDDDRCFGVQIGDAGLLRLLNRGINVLGSDYAQNLAFRYTDQLYSYSVWDKAETTIPAAFEAVKTKKQGQELAREIRMKCRSYFGNAKVLSRVARDIAWVLQAGSEEEQSEALQTGDLWDDETDTALGGQNYGNQGDEA